jgi:iodotyrosine deiodinase
MLALTAINESRADSDFFKRMNARRTCRHFKSETPDLNAIVNCIRVAGTAPSGANSQPWFFALVTDPRLRADLRQAAENEEKEFYFKRASSEFLQDLAILKTNWQKPHLTEAGALIVVFSKTFNEVANEKKRCYYPRESTGIAVGMLITALHMAGFDMLTHTPSPMNFLNELLERPTTEKPFLILAVGARDRSVALPDISRKQLSGIMKFYGVEP